MGERTDWKRIYCGEQYLFAERKDGTWWVCGVNYDGNLGLGSEREVLEISWLRQFPYSFDPWALAAGTEGTTTLALLRDGTLWTCGIRLGEKKPTTKFNNLKVRANRLGSRIPGKPFVAIRQFESDTIPTKIWCLPHSFPESENRLPKTELVNTN